MASKSKYISRAAATDDREDIFGGRSKCQSHISEWLLDFSSFKDQRPGVFLDATLPKGLCSYEWGLRIIRQSIESWNDRVIITIIFSGFTTALIHFRDYEERKTFAVKFTRAESVQWWGSYRGNICKSETMGSKARVGVSLAQLDSISAR